MSRVFRGGNNRGVSTGRGTLVIRCDETGEQLILQEYAYNYRLPLVINRCGVLTGPWQMGRVDQGIFTYWVARHLLKLPLRYTGFGGTGKQVRHLLHVDDLFDLIARQIEHVSSWSGEIYNVGGGFPVSTSLLELTEKCRGITGNTVSVGSVPETASVDVRIYITDTARAMRVRLEPSAGSNCDPRRNLSLGPRESHSTSTALSIIEGAFMARDVLSIVVPAYNEEKNLPKVVSELQQLLRAESIPYEFVLVNDNSKDGTSEGDQELIAADERVRLREPAAAGRVRTGRSSGFGSRPGRRRSRLHGGLF